MSGLLLPAEVDLVENSPRVRIEEKEGRAHPEDGMPEDPSRSSGIPASQHGLDGPDTNSHSDRPQQPSNVPTVLAIAATASTATKDPARSIQELTNEFIYSMIEKLKSLRTEAKIDDIEAKSSDPADGVNSAHKFSSGDDGPKTGSSEFGLTKRFETWPPQNMRTVEVLEQERVRLREGLTEYATSTSFEYSHT